VVWAEGNYFPGYWYRVTVHEVGSINPPSARLPPLRLPCPPSMSTSNTLAFPSNPPAATPFLAGTDAAPGPTGHECALDTTTPNKMQPCGYVVRLDVSDRSIVDSVPGQHNGSSIAVGFCLRSAM